MLFTCGTILAVVIVVHDLGLRRSNKARPIPAPLPPEGIAYTCSHCHETSHLTQKAPTVQGWQGKHLREDHVRHQRAHAKCICLPCYKKINERIMLLEQVAANDAIPRIVIHRATELTTPDSKVVDTLFRARIDVDGLDQATAEIAGQLCQDGTELDYGTVVAAARALLD